MTDINFCTCDPKDLYSIIRDNKEGSSTSSIAPKLKEGSVKMADTSMNTYKMDALQAARAYWTIHHAWTRGNSSIKVGHALKLLGQAQSAVSPSSLLGKRLETLLWDIIDNAPNPPEVEELGVAG